MEWNGLEVSLREALGGRLPGATGQGWLSPRPRSGWDPGVIPDGLRPGAALVLFFPSTAGPALLLTVRDARLLQHAGQVSLPGGALEPGETIVQAALREAEEEVGLDARTVRIMGRLSPLHIPVSRFVLHPVVGIVDERPAFKPRDGEVARIIEAPFRAIADPTLWRIERRTFRGVEYRVPYLVIEGEKLWGATAMVVAELLTLVGATPDPWSAENSPTTE